jgi:hypothetical protein
MTFHQIKSAILGIVLGSIIATAGYLLSTASYVGTSTSLILEPQQTEAGTRWLGQTDELEIEVRYISSLTEKPAITIRKKQQWPKLAICLSAGILFAYFSYRLMVRKEKSHTEPSPSKPSETTPAPEPSPTETTSLSDHS